MNDNPLTATFDGYLRADGRRGVRNWLVVAYTVYCAEHVPVGSQSLSGSKGCS